MSARSFCIRVALGVYVLLNNSTRLHAQGTVNFNNSVLVPYLHDLVIVRGLDSSLFGTNNVAQLYYGTSASLLVPLTNAPAPFRPGTSGPGIWLGGTRTLGGIAPGHLAVLSVRVWNILNAPTYEEAVATGSFWKDNGPFYYEVKSSGLDPTNYFMFNFRALNHVGLRCDHLTNMPPSFHDQPQSLTVTRGQNITLTATVTNACLGHWRFNGVFAGGGGVFNEVRPDFFGYGSHPLRITNAQPSHAGSYQFIAENYVGSVTSEVAVLTVLTPSQLTAARYDQGSFAFQVLDDAGEAVIIETAPDLNPATTWTPVFTNTTPFWFTNSAPADRQRFYRTVLR